MTVSGVDRDPIEPGFESEIAEVLQPMALKSQRLTRIRWLGYTLALILGALLTHVLDPSPDGYARYLTIAVPGALVAYVVWRLARAEARDFEAFVDWLCQRNDSHYQARWDAANRLLFQSELTRAQALSQGAFILLLVAFAAERLLTGDTGILKFAAYFIVGCFLIGFLMGLLGAFLTRSGFPQNAVNGVIGLTVVCGVFTMLYFAQIWAVGSDVSFLGFMLRGLVGYFLFIFAGMVVGGLGGLFSALANNTIRALGDRQLVSLPTLGFLQTDLLLHKVMAQSVLFWAAAVAYAPVLVLASEHLYTPLVFGFGFLTFAGLFFAVIIWSAVDVKAEQFSVFILLIQAMLLTLAISFTLAVAVGYAASTVIRSAFEWIFGELGAMFFPDAVLSAIRLPALEFPLADAALGIALATAALYVFSYLVAIINRRDGLRILFLLVLAAAFIAGPRVMEAFDFAMPDELVQPVAALMSVNPATVNQLLLVIPLYLLLLCVQALFTRKFRCDGPDCRAPAMYEHVGHCWKCGKRLNLGRDDEARALPPN